MGEIIYFPGADPDESPFITCECGGTWWTGGSVVWEDTKVTAYTVGDWKCASCGEDQYC